MAVPAIELPFADIKVTVLHAKCFIAPSKHVVATAKIESVSASIIGNILTAWHLAANSNWHPCLNHLIVLTFDLMGSR